MHRSWKSFYRLKKTDGIEKPRPPRYKHKNYNIIYLNNGFKILPGNKVCFSLSKQLKAYLKENYGFQENYLIVDVPNHLRLESYDIKTIEIKPLPDGKYELIFITEITDIERKVNYQKFMSIDIGSITSWLAISMTAHTKFIPEGNFCQSTGILIKPSLTINPYPMQSNQAGSKIPQTVQKSNKLYEKRRKQVNHLLHCMTRDVIDTAVTKDVNVIFIGDITNIRDGANFGKRTNQNSTSCRIEKR